MILARVIEPTPNFAIHFSVVIVLAIVGARWIDNRRNVALLASGLGYVFIFCLYWQDTSPWLSGPSWRYIVCEPITAVPYALLDRLLGIPPEIGSPGLFWKFYAAVPALFLGLLVPAALAYLIAIRWAPADRVSEEGGKLSQDQGQETAGGRTQFRLLSLIWMTALCSVAFGLYRVFGESIQQFLDSLYRQESESWLPFLLVFLLVVIWRPVRWFRRLRTRMRIDARDRKEKAVERANSVAKHRHGRTRNQLPARMLKNRRERDELF